jgi:hypothetical protein
MVSNGLDPEYEEMNAKGYEGMNIRERVHIMPVGYEFDRIILPAERYRADRIILIGHTEDSEFGRKNWNRVTSKLDNMNIPYERYQCNIFDLYSSLSEITKAIVAHSEDEVYVNVASGSKVTAIGGMIASMVMEASAYYVKAEEYASGSDNGELSTPESIEYVYQLPRYPINAPDIQQVAVMEFVAKCEDEQAPPTKGEVIEFSERIELPYIEQNVAEKGKYRILDSKILDPLTEQRYILENKSGRNKVLSLTENGRAALSAFRWMVDDRITWDDQTREKLTQ